jgi:hypothetical protein
VQNNDAGLLLGDHRVLLAAAGTAASVLLAMTNADRCVTASMKGAQRRACAIVTLRANGRQWCGHEHASADAARREHVEREYRVRPDVLFCRR